MANKEIDAQNILKKDKNEMTDMERAMASIIEKNNKELETKENENEEVSIPEAPKKRVIHEVPQKPELPEELRQASATNLQREKQITKAVRKNKKLPVVGILIAFLIGAFVLFSAMVKNINKGAVDNDTAGVRDGNNAEVIISTPEPQEVLDVIEEEGPIVMISGTNSDESNGEIYKVFISDLSWTEAKKKCSEMEGHLVTITSEEELDELIALAEDAEIDRFWVGCHRNTEGYFTWENNEEYNIPTGWWGKNEPSGYDVGDNAVEDYLLLWYNNGKWSLNDSRNDPCEDYPEMYSGHLAYICEFERNKKTAELVIDE